MGVVYKARQVSVNRLVALKLLRWGHNIGDDQLMRFRNETEAVAALDHPHVVPILEVGRHEGQPYFTMKLLGGGSIAQRLPGYSCDPRAAAALIVPVAEAVYHAHRRGILHRDLQSRPTSCSTSKTRPARRRLRAGEAAGRGRRADPLARDHRNACVHGAPSKADRNLRARHHRHRRLRPRGHPLRPVDRSPGVPGRDGLMETLRLVREATPVPPSRLNPRVALATLETICLKCLQKDPADRYGSAEAVVVDLNRYLSNT